MSTDWILVTGQPGCGKTTAVQKMVAFLTESGFDCRGFYTEEVRQNGGRIGFDVVTVPSGERGVLARIKGLTSSYPKTGKYLVDVASFEKLALPSLALEEKKGKTEDRSKVIYVLDEIGRMELHSTKFQQHVHTMLQGCVRLVGAITAPRYGNRVAFCDEVSNVDGVQVRNLTKANRDQVVGKMLQQIKRRWIHNNDDMAPN